MLIDCPECAARVSSNAPACPQCGSPMKKQAPAGQACPPSPVQPHQPGEARFPRGPVGGPMIPYRPETFSSLYLWFAILFGVSIPLMFVFFVGFGTLIASVVLSYVLLFKAWNQIQDGHQRTSAGKAVGFSFIPFFNFYWAFVANYGLAQDLNAYARRYHIPAPPVGEGLALTYCILSVCSIIPYLGLLAALAAFVIMFVFFHQIKAASMAIALAKLQATSGSPAMRAQKP